MTDMKKYYENNALLQWGSLVLYYDRSNFTAYKAQDDIKVNHDGAARPATEAPIIFQQNAHS